MRAVLGSIALAMAAITPGIAQQQTNYIALALSDGPSPAQRLVISVRGSNANDVVASAYKGCYQRAVQGYMHTCQVWYGDAWIVGTICQQTPTAVKLAIGDDPNSPEAAKDKALKYLRDVEHADVSNCRVVAEYNANNVEAARSVSKDVKK